MKNFFNSAFELKLEAIKKILKSKSFVLMDFTKKDDLNGYCEAYFTPGFTLEQRNTYMTVAELVCSDRMRDELITKKNLEKAKQLLNE